MKTLKSTKCNYVFSGIEGCSKDYVLECGKSYDVPDDDAALLLTGWGIEEVLSTAPETPASVPPPAESETDAEESK